MQTKKDLQAAINLLRKNGFDDFMDISSPASNTLSGIIRIAPTKAEAEAHNKKKREDAKRGDKIMRAVSKGGKEKAKGIKGRDIDYQNMASDIWSKNSNLSKNAVAFRIFKKLSNEGIHSLSKETIRKKIVK